MMRIPSLCLAIVITMLGAGVAAAQVGSQPALPDSGSAVTPAYEGPQNAPTADQIAFRQFRSRMAALRDEGLSLRAADGGTLTPEHRALIQRKLDAIQAEYAPYRDE